jgi:hypothetical protein
VFAMLADRQLAASRRPANASPYTDKTRRADQPCAAEGDRLGHLSAPRALTSPLPFPRGTASRVKRNGAWFFRNGAPEAAVSPSATLQRRADNC